MRLHRTLAAIAGLATLLAVAAPPARADWDDHGRGGWHRPWYGYRPYYPPVYAPPVYAPPIYAPPVFVPAPPVYYPPPGVVWAPAFAPPPYWVRSYRR